MGSTVILNLGDEREEIKKVSKQYTYNNGVRYFAYLNIWFGFEWCVVKTDYLLKSNKKI